MSGVFGAACARAHQGMEIAAVAELAPARPAVISSFGCLDYAELNRQINKVARLLRRAGLDAGDAVALVCGNRPEFIVVRFACHRIGVRLTPVNWHLAAAEVAYVVDNCDARAVFLDSDAAPGAIALLALNPKLELRVAIGEPVADFLPWEATLDDIDGSDIEAPILGGTMLYTSGTTGRPKGVLRKQPDPHKAADMQALLAGVFQFQPDTGRDRALVTGPLYHAGPLNLCMTIPLNSGIGVVLMEKFSAGDTLRLIETEHITHTFLVPTMMVRLLQLPGTVRERADISSVRFIIHGAAPCPVGVKQKMLDWFGPVVWEMFAGTEGPGTLVSPAEWLARPGTVGKAAPGQLKILDDEGRELGPNVSGHIYLANPPDSAFEYYRDVEKTGRALRDGYFTAGDIGYLDEGGYLFLTGRSAEVIISGGVNIYPQEIDDVLLQHPAVIDVACVGVPNPEWGEEVKALVVLAEGCEASALLEDRLLDYCAGKIARQKIPRSVDFVPKIARSEAGKVLRSALREPFWADRDGVI